jgi:hypothetical protein
MPLWKQPSTRLWIDNHSHAEVAAAAQKWHLPNISFNTTQETCQHAIAIF